MPTTLQELMDLLLPLLPKAMVEEGEDGELIIMTGKRVENDKLIELE